MTRSILGTAFALIAVSMLGGEVANAGPGWWGDLDKGEVVDLKDIMAEPTGFRDRQLTFTCITSGKANVFFQESAIVSRQRYTNYAVWPDGAIVWRESDYKGKDFPFLFIAKNHFQHDELLGLRKFTRIEVTGRIKAILRGKAHIEVTSWRPTSHRFGGLVWDAMLRGDRYADGGDWDLAIEKYKEALRPDLPPAYALAIRKQLGAALRQVGRHTEAAEVEGGGILAPDDYKDGSLPLPGVTPEDSPPEFAPLQPGSVPPFDRGSGTAPPAGAAPPPIDDQLPGVRPRSTGTPDAPIPGGFDAPPSVPTPSRGERANPFLDDDLPGMAAGTPRQPAHQPLPRPLPGAQPALPEPRSSTPRGNGFPPPNGFPPAAPQADRAAPAPRGPGTPFSAGDDLPGQPVYPESAPPPGAERGGAQRPAPTKPPTARPSTPSGRPILPPKRRPRLAGVK